MSPFPSNFKGKPPQEGEFGVVPEGIYYAIIQETKETTSSKGDPQVIVDFQITTGSYQGSTIREWITFVDSMEGRNKHLLMVLGQVCDDDAVIRPKDWEGQELRIRVRHREYQGKPQSRIAEFLYLEDQEPEKEVQEAKEKIEKTFGEEEPPIPQEASEEKEEDKDTIPF
jgi:hypothetical protein